MWSLKSSDFVCFAHSFSSLFSSSSSIFSFSSLSLPIDSFKYPLCVRDVGKALLTTAIWNDSLFLSSQDVMDYSLVVGIDEEKGELVVGIIG